MRILLLDDNIFENAYIIRCLEKEGHYVNNVFDGETAFSFLFHYYDIYLVNIDMPNISGLEILDHIKSINSNTFVIMFSSNPSNEMIKKAYEYGCNDFLVFPFECIDLVEKINLIDNNKEIRLANGLIYDSISKKITYENNEIILTKNELKLFVLLVSNLERCIQKDQIISYIYENKLINKNFEYVNKGTVRTLIYRLRKKLPENTIETLSNKDGYSINIQRV